MLAQRLLALVTLLSVVPIPGCGGQAVDDQSGDGDGDGDGDAPVAPVDPLSDAGFPDALSDRFRVYCGNIEQCDTLPDQATCQEVEEQIPRLYDVDSRECRSLLLESLDCVNGSWNNCAVSVDCSPVADQLEERCAMF